MKRPVYSCHLRCNSHTFWKNLSDIANKHCVLKQLVCCYNEVSVTKLEGYIWLFSYSISLEWLRFTLLNVCIPSSSTVCYPSSRFTCSVALCLGGYPARTLNVLSPVSS
jgi:hypothetical protein